MKKLAAATAVIVLLGAPAIAGEHTIMFEPTDGEAFNLVFDHDTKLVTDPEGGEHPYTWDEEALTLCGDMPDGQVCATFEEKFEELGASTGYTSTNGNEGTATLVSATGEDE